MSAAYNPGYNRAVTITKSDTANYDGSASGAERNASAADAIYIGGAGTVIVVFPDATTATFTCVAAQTLPVKSVRVGASSSATLMLALFNI